MFLILEPSCLENAPSAITLTLLGITTNGLACEISPVYSTKIPFIIQNPSELTIFLSEPNSSAVWALIGVETHAVSENAFAPIVVIFSICSKSIFVILE